MKTTSLILAFLFLVGCTNTGGQSKEVWEKTLDAVEEAGTYRVHKSGMHLVEERDLNISYLIEEDLGRGYYRRTCRINDYDLYEIVQIGGSARERWGEDNWTDASAAVRGKETVTKELLGMNRNASVTLLGSENLNGEECWVLKTDQEGGLVKKEIELWVSKTDYLPRKRVEKVTTMVGEGSWLIIIEYPINLTIVPEKGIK